MGITCKGWFRKFLQTQMDDLTGHIEEAGFPFDRVEWGKQDIECDNDNPNWWVYKSAPVKRGEFLFTPSVPSKPQFVGEEEEICLKPYGACKASR